MQKIIDALTSLGLTDKEAKMYIALYKLGKATAYQIAKEAGVKRPTVYALMDELRKKGLALVVPHEKNQVFIAKNPHEFISEYQMQFNKNAHDILGSLPTLTKPAEETGVIVFKGSGTLAQGLSYGLHRTKEKQIYAFYASVGKHAKVNPAYTEHAMQIHQLGLKLKCIIPSDSADEVFRKDDKKYGFEIKKINHTLFSPNISVEICGDVVKIIFHKKKEVMTIEEKELADFYKQIFMVMWRV